MSDLKKVFLEKDTTLDFTPFKETRAYGYTCQVFENNKLVHTITYEIAVDSSHSYAQDGFIFEVDRKTVYLDNASAASQTEQIADLCSQALYPLKLKVSDENLLLEILNHADIKQRWKKIKDNLSLYYKGKIISALLQKTEKLLYNKTVLTTSLYETWFFDLYFRPIYTTYQHNESLDYFWKSPVLGNKHIRYGVEQSLEENYTATDKTVIKLKGSAVDKRSIQEILQHRTFPKNTLAGVKVKPVHSEMNVEYQLYSEDNSIFSIVAEYQITLQEEKQKTVKIELYHLPESATFRPAKTEKAVPVTPTSIPVEDEDYIFDISTIAVPKKKQKSDQMILGSPPKVIQLYIPGPYPPDVKKSLWKRIFSIFKKKKKIIEYRQNPWKKTTT